MFCVFCRCYYIFCIFCRWYYMFCVFFRCYYIFCIPNPLTSCFISQDMKGLKLSTILKARTAITAYCASKAGNALPSRQPQFWNRKIIETRKSLGRNDCSRNRRRRQNYYTQTELLRLRSFQNLGKKILQKPNFHLYFFVATDL